MPYYTYIIYSATKDRYYVGQCENLHKRLLDHNNSRSGYSKGLKDWELKWRHEFARRSEAVRAEGLIKRKKSRKYLEYLVGGGLLPIQSVPEVRGRSAGRVDKC